MRRLLLLIAGIAGAVLVTFGIAMALGVPVLTETERYLAAGGTAATALAVGLLVADVVLPVPSSLLLAYLGATHGVVVGAALGTAANVAAAALGFAIGRLSRGAIGRWLGDQDRARVDALLARWSLLGIAASRPIPVLAETVAIVSGTSRSTGWGRFLLAATAGAAPYAVINAAAGSQARDGNFAVALLACLAIGGLLWLVGRSWQRQRDLG